MAEPLIEKKPVTKAPQLSIVKNKPEGKNRKGACMAITEYTDAIAIAAGS